MVQKICSLPFFQQNLVLQGLIPQASWQPYPTIAERAQWLTLSKGVRRQLIFRAEQYLHWTWPALPATLFLEFVRTGNRVHYEEEYFARRQTLLALLMGECADGKGRFLDDIINGIWVICEESFWGLPAHNFHPPARFLPSASSTSSPHNIGLPDTAYRIIDLFAAETGALLAWTWYLLKPVLTQTLPVVLDRIEREIQERLLEPYRTISDWRWLGSEASPANNWNPWIHSNLLAVTLLMESDTEQRTQTVSRILAGLDRFLAGYHSDGGCDEGPGYWDNAAGSLFDSLDLLYRASEGKLNAFGIPLIQEMGRFIMRTHIGGSWYVNFADAAARLTPSGELIYRYGQRINDPLLMRQGAFIVRNSVSSNTAITNLSDITEQDRLLISSIYHYQRVPGRLLPALFETNKLVQADATPPLLLQTWLDGIEVLVTREQMGTEQGLFLAAKGGHNDESHNHNDIGSFLVALNGEPIILDIGVGIYTRQTFNEERYNIWTMRSSYHNVPLINGYEQQAGRAFRAQAVRCTLTDDLAELALDLAEAYPADAALLQWQRTLRLERKGKAKIVLKDVYRFAAAPQTLALHLMVRDSIQLAEPGRLLCNTPTRPLEISYDSHLLQPQIERIEITDEKIAANWGQQIFRVILACRTPLKTEGELELVLQAL